MPKRMEVKVQNLYLHSPGTENLYIVNQMKFKEEVEKYSIEELKKMTSFSESGLKRLKKYVYQGNSENVVSDSTYLSQLNDMGKSLCKDKMAFLQKIKINNDTVVIKDKPIIINIPFLTAEKIQLIISQLHSALDELVYTDNYNYIGGTAFDSFASYNKQRKDIEELASVCFFGNESVADRINGLIDDVFFCINSRSIPGVPNRWFEINPNLRYFDVVYDMIGTDAYELVRKSPAVHFKFEPTKAEIKSRKEYFEQKRKSSPDLNELNFYQDELVKALNKISTAVFSELR